jgi:hypothetical protein
MASAVQENTLRARFGEPASPMQRVIEQAPYIAHCSDDKTATKKRPTDYAVRWPYMQLNRSGMVSWLIFDCDHGDVFRWDAAGLPPPNLIVANRNGGPGFHLFYAITPVCTTEKAREHPQRYMRAIRARMVELLGADPNYHGGGVSKTPGHPWWHTIELHSHEYSLGELNEYFELPREELRFGKVPDLSVHHHARHATLFHELRYFAYSIVNGMKEQSTYDAFFQRLMTEAQRLNNYGSKRGFIDLKRMVPHTDLRASQVRATVRSIARWTWDKYTGDGRCNRGVMRLSKALPLAERQRLAAERTHGERSKATAARIQAACGLLRAKGEALTQTALAALTRLSRQTVAKYQHLIDEFASRVAEPAAPKGEAARQPVIVKFATCQITAPPAAAGDAGTSGVQRAPGRPALRLVVGGPAPPLDSS